MATSRKSGHPGAYVAFVENLDTGASSGKVHRKATSRDARADDDHFDVAASVRRGHIF
jgi:hypothetical protein